MKTLNYKLSVFVYLIFFYAALYGCGEYIEIDPPATSLTASSVFLSDATAESAVVGIYVEMIRSSSTFLSGERSFTWMAGLSSDELVSYFTDDRKNFELNELSDDNTVLISHWRQIYRLIYATNAAVEGLASSKQLTVSVKRALEGEVKFIRAFLYFYLVNFWGDVPLLTSTDYQVNASIARTPVVEIYNQIIADLEDAQKLLPEFPEGERTRPCKAAATALLARAYLYKGDWAKAEGEATTIIAQKSTYLLESDLNSVFRKESQETIWQVQPVSPQINTWDGRRFILVNSPTRVTLREGLVNTFESGDNRSLSWVNRFDTEDTSYYYPYKYKIRSLPLGEPAREYSVVFRLAEQFLIRAEARAHQGNLDGARSDLDMVRNRAGLANTLATDQSAILQAIEHERRVELFTEGGHRWLDLKRTGRADAVLAQLKPGWQSTDALYPVPQDELRRNPNLTQNAGY